MTLTRLKKRDIEWVERARRDSSHSSSASEPEPSASRAPQKYKDSSLLDEPLVDVILTTNVMGSDNGTASKKAGVGGDDGQDEMCQKFFIWKLRLLHSVMAAVLTYVGLQQMDRYDAPVWLAIFLVPAMITMASTIRIRFVDGVCVRSLISVYLGSCLCFLIWLGTSLLVAMVEQSQTPYPSYNPLDYQQGREVLAVAICIGWQKFHLVTTNEQMKITHYTSYQSSLKAGVSPHQMLKRLLILLLLPAALAAFCYIESVKPALLSTKNAITRAII